MRKSLLGLSMLAMIGALTVLCLDSSWAQSTLNCNKCVDTGDLAKKSVSSSRLKKGAVKGNRIKDGAVTRSKIAPGAVESGKLAAGAVTGAKLAPGAVAAANIATGTVTADKLDADALAGTLLLERTVLVSPVGDGSDTTANGMELLDAMASLGSVAPAPGADTPWRVKIEPGIYDVGTTPVRMRSFVDLEGSGSGITEIVGNVDSTNSSGVLVTASNTELRYLSVLNTGGGTNTFAIVSSGDNVRINSVLAEGQAATTQSNGIRIVNTGGSNFQTTLRDVTSTAGQANFSHGVVSTGQSDTALDNVRAVSTSVAGTRNGIFMGGGTLVVRNSVTESSGGAVFVGAALTANISATQLIGSASGSGSFACIGAYSAAFAPLGSNCN